MQTLNVKNNTYLAVPLVAFAFVGLGAAIAATPASEGDKAFVAKVSQGGMYEVELGKLAEKRGFAQDIKDQGNTESHDHQLVGEKLKAAAKESGIAFASDLNEEFKARLAKISALSGRAFDTAYIADMEKIHAADGAAFLKEAKYGASPALKAFAAETHNIVLRHIGELKARTTEID